MNHLDSIDQIWLTLVCLYLGWDVSDRRWNRKMKKRQDELQDMDIKKLEQTFLDSVKAGKYRCVVSEDARGLILNVTEIKSRYVCCEHCKHNDMQTDHPVPCSDILCRTGRRLRI